MGFFDRFKKKKKIEEIKDEKITIQTQVPDDRLKWKYEIYLETINSLRKKCEANQRQYIIESISIPKSYEEYCQRYDYFSKQFEEMNSILQKYESEEKDKAIYNTSLSSDKAIDDFERTLEKLNQTRGFQVGEGITVATPPGIGESYQKASFEFDKLRKREQKQELAQKIFEELKNEQIFKENIKKYGNSQCY